MSDMALDTGAGAANDPRLRSRLVELAEVRLHCVEAGAGPLLLFLHGFPEFWFAWRHQFGAFCADYHTVAPDMRGYNLSGKPDGVENYRIQRLVDDIVELVTQLGHDRAYLVGHDWGGAVAWAAAMSRPDIFQRLIILNAPHPILFRGLVTSNPKQMKASAYMAAFQDSKTEQYWRESNYARPTAALLEPGLAQGYFTESDAALYRAAWSQPGALTAMLNYYRALNLNKPDGKDRQISKLDVPTLVLWGLKDSYLLPENLDGLDQYVSDVRIVRVDDADHWVVHQKPDLVNREIRSFLADAG